MLRPLLEPPTLALGERRSLFPRYQGRYGNPRIFSSLVSLVSAAFVATFNTQRFWLGINISLQSETAARLGPTLGIFTSRISMGVCNIIIPLVLYSSELNGTYPRRLPQALRHFAVLAADASASASMGFPLALPIIRTTSHGDRDSGPIELDLSSESTPFRGCPFSINVNDAILWAGMVFSVNAVESSPNNFGAFKKLAMSSGDSASASAPAITTKPYTAPPGQSWSKGSAVVTHDIWTWTTPLIEAPAPTYTSSRGVDTLNFSRPNISASIGDGVISSSSTPQDHTVTTALPDSDKTTSSEAPTRGQDVRRSEYNAMR
ncbi:hypothetical protein DFH09DRAFT_1100634 [Mycena vulgaris]|nr:hypothetical protein DFH09DRAFT_1100634 [Mycena vulgaris]